MTPTNSHMPISPPPNTTACLGWDELGRNAKLVEGNIDGRLLELSQACRMATEGTVVKELGDEIEQELSELANLIEAMEETLGDEPDHSKL